MKKMMIIFVVLIIFFLVFLIADYCFLFTKQAALRHGKELLLQEYGRPEEGDALHWSLWPEYLSLKAEKKEGIWEVYDEKFDYRVTFSGRNQSVTFDPGF